MGSKLRKSTSARYRREKGEEHLKRKQKRGADQGVQSHLRITLELRHILLKFCSGDPPVGAMDKALLIVGGDHCRLANIDVETSTWIESEEFLVQTAAGPVKVKRHAGAKVNQNMREWVALKKRRAHLFTHVEFLV